MWKKLLECGCGEQWNDLGPFVLRVVVGLIFLAHGYQKYTWGTDAVSGFLSQLGFPAPEVFAVILIAAEIAGGVALILGLFTHWMAKLMSVVAVVALVSVHLKNGFFLQNNAAEGGGYEFIILILAATVSLGITGAGRWSLDALLLKKGDSIQSS